jgi:long-chain acyl-CoA synthetase
VGVPDREIGQRVKVYVVTEEGYTPGEALEQELLAFHNDNCAGFKKIRELAFVPTLARNSNGKIIRSQFKTAE